MKLTAVEKQKIRTHWYHSYSHFRFERDGTVLAKRYVKDSWGVLYTPEQTELHLAELAKIQLTKG